MRRLVILGLILLLVAIGQAADLDLGTALRWRCIGPYRGGRTVGATGVPGHPNEFLIGVNNGGVWKTNDYGRTWKPLFDDQPTGSIGAVAVAPSDANVIYVGSGEGLQRPDLSTGDGLYRSGDGGKTWQNMGLRDAQQISAITVDPRNPNRLYVAALGHPYGANEERGLFKSEDGGKSFTRALWKNVDTGAVAVALDPKNPDIVYCDMWAARQGPWENGSWQGPGSGLYKSMDRGKTWQRLEKGLPTIEEGLGRVGFAIAPSRPSRIFATVDSRSKGGIYRSDDSGRSWERVSTEQRLWGRGDDFAEVRVDPQNPDRVYVANTSLYRSDDGGKNYVCIKGSPGGDDYHTVWIARDNPDVILLAGDQGAAVSVNGGETWSSWYNQATAQFYHVSTDNRFPYWVYGGQQESGSAGVPSRGPYGRIDFRDWYPVGAEEYGYVAADPLNPDVVYGGKLTKFWHSTRQVQRVRPSQPARYLRTAPVIFSPVDPHILFFAGNVLFKTADGAATWTQVSPDLSREHPDVPGSIGVYRKPEMAAMARRGVIYSVGPSYKEVDTIWAGTDDGLVHLTLDGGKIWKDVTPPELTAWSKVSQIDPGRFDDATAYIAVNRIRLDDQRPHIYRTHDYGAHWTRIVAGLPESPVNTVREDPVRRGLLYCGTERAVYFSLDDGDHWQSLRGNMPATSIRDLVIKDADVVVGTHGRSFWILDDISPLRQGGVGLYAPSVSYRLAWNLNTDTPLPQDEPFGENPPDGSILYYNLGSRAGSVTLEILDLAGTVLRRVSSSDPPAKVDPLSITVMPGWARKEERLGTEAGLHRYVWDQHALDSVPGRPGLGMDSIWQNTPLQPRGRWVDPGTYTVRLTVDGKVESQTLRLLPDPRMH